MQCLFSAKPRNLKAGYSVGLWNVSQAVTSGLTSSDGLFEYTSSEQDVTTPLSQEQDSEANEEAMTWSVSSNNAVKPINAHGFTILSISQGK